MNGSSRKHIQEDIRSFYNRTPFPDFELNRFNTSKDLKEAAWPMARLLDFLIPQRASVIDVGCGTGQLAALLSLRGREVRGIDFSDSSIIKAQHLKEKLKLETLQVSKADILDPHTLKSIVNQFDYLLCLGVLHHTKNPAVAFQNILSLVKPGGVVVIGLYNKFGRVPLKIRRWLARSFWGKGRIWMSWVKMQIGDLRDSEKIRGWWNDQYLCPYESSHTVGEVLKWFEEAGVDYLQSMPSVRLSHCFFGDEPLDFSCQKIRKSSLLLRGLAQAIWIFSTHTDGGYWVTIGRKRDI